MRLKSISLAIFLILLTTLNTFAQNDLRSERAKNEELLLKKGLSEAIKEAESSSANDSAALLRRLDLYHRIVNNPKIAAIVRQIVETADLEKNRAAIAQSVGYALKDEFFKDAETLRFYLQNIEFDDEIYGKFYRLCAETQSACDVAGFDEWLARQADKAHGKDFWGADVWMSRRIGWREKFGLGNAEILERLAAAVRENPADLKAALRYAKFERRAPEIEWLAETFASQKSYDYFELGEALSGDAISSSANENQKRQIMIAAVRLLRKSLDLPYQATDKDLIVARRFRYVSIAPRIGNYEKQLRFWTKTRLAETFQKLNEPHKAQPLVEELAALDKSDIMAGNTDYLAGAVQAASGARVVEAKILREQGSRQNSYEYWQGRIAYYHGRKEPERIFDAFRQAFAVVPFDLGDETSRDARLFFVRRFADFAEDEYGYYANEKIEEISDEQKQKHVFWKDAENFLRAEYEKTKSNTHYSAALVRIIIDNKFKKLLDEIFRRDPHLPVAFARINTLSANDYVLYYFLQSESVTKTQKETVIGQILKIAEEADAKNAWLIGEAVVSADEAGTYAARIVPILVKNLEKTEKLLNTANISDEDKSEAESVRNKYLENLFKTYLQINDWKSAEKLLFAPNNWSLGYRLWQLAENAAKNNAFSDALRFWTLKANLNRRDVDNLETLAKRAEVKELLKEFYRQIKANEPFSPVPDLALQKLK